MISKIEPGTHLWSVATGTVRLLSKRSRDAAKFIVGLEGFTAYHNMGSSILWLFDSMQNAVIARNIMNAKGIQTGNNICEFEVDDDGSMAFCEGQM